MTIKDFVLLHRDLSVYSSEVSKLKQKSVVQALRHTTRSEMDDLHNIARPNEDEIFEKWRKDNHRSVTVDYTNQFIRMLQRICSQTIRMDFEDYKDLDRYVNDALIPLSAQDVNTIIVEWPFIPGALPNIPPASTEFAANQPIDSETYLIYSEKILEDNKDMIIWFKDMVMVGKQVYKRYSGVDKEAFYILEPRLDGKRLVYYEPIVWYMHGLDRLPVSRLPGIIINHKTQKGFQYYRESICWPAYEWFDEGIVRMSSEQVVSIKYANAKLVVNAEIECPTCTGTGYVGSEIDKVTGNPIPKVCTQCNGNRKLTNIGDFSTINIREKVTAPNAQGSNSNPIYYLEPPAGIKELQATFMLFFENGKKALCNDPLETTGNESGIAKEMRLEPKQDLMKAYGQQLCYLIEDMVNNRIMLRGGKQEIRVTPPIYYETKSPEVMKLQVTDSLQGERYMRYMDYVQAKYRDDENIIRLHKFAVLYAPLILYKADEFDGAFNAGVYDERDAIRRDYAFFAVGEVLRKQPKLEDLKSIKVAADKFLTEQGILPEALDVELDMDQRAKILDTVGGG